MMSVPGAVMSGFITFTSNLLGPRDELPDITGATAPATAKLGLKLAMPPTRACAKTCVSWVVCRCTIGMTAATVNKDVADAGVAIATFCAI